MKVAINGFGKVGQALLRRLTRSTEIDVVVINEIKSSVERAVRVFQESGRGSNAENSPTIRGGNLHVCERTIVWQAEKEPRNLGWERHKVDVAVEASRLFLRREMEDQSAGGRITILMTGDLADQPPDLTLVLGVNDAEYQPEQAILCMGSDRTQALVPVLSVLHSRLGVLSYRACVLRTPYKDDYGQVQHQAKHAQQLARALPPLNGRGKVYRVDDSDCRCVTVWLDVAVDSTVDNEHARDALHAAAEKFPAAVIISDQLADPVGSTYSALIDASSIKTRMVKSKDRQEYRIYLKFVYDPLVSYVERLLEQLCFLAQHRL